MTLLLGMLLLGVEPDRLVDRTAEWEKDPAPILGGFHNLYNPRILQEPGEEYPFKMWFFGYAAEDNNPGHHGGDIIYFARAKDLHSWEVYGGEKGWLKTVPGDPPVWPDPRDYAPVLAPDPEAFDNMACGDPSVVKRDGRYHMAYSGVRFDTWPGPDGTDRLYLMDSVMGAVSDDGIRWERSKRPLLLWSRELENPWELVVKDGEVIDSRPDNYYGRYHRPSLLFDEGRWKIWFDYFHPGTFLSMGYAENDGAFLDPDAWRVLCADEQPLLKDFPNPNVIRIGDTYHAFSDATGYPPEMGGDGRQITVASSSDGLTWSVLGHLRPEGTASSHVPETALLDTGSGPRLHLFYAWKPAQVEGQPWEFRYKEIRMVVWKTAIDTPE
jgi:hypothetical protein